MGADLLGAIVSLLPTIETTKKRGKWTSTTPPPLTPTAWKEIRIENTSFQSMQTNAFTRLPSASLKHAI